jgi:hypothetical protein
VITIASTVAQHGGVGDGGDRARAGAINVPN